MVRPANGPAAVDDDGPEPDGALTHVLKAIGGLMAAFTAAWQRGSITSDALAALIGQAANIVDDLAAELAAIHDGLEEQAHTASRYGVKIGADGRPPPVPAGWSADAAEASERHWALAYKQAFEHAMTAARQARQRAASRLTDMYAAIEPARQSPVIAATGHAG